MIGLALDLLETSVRCGSWVVSGIYYGGYKLIYGSKKDPVLERLDDLENKMNLYNNEQSLNQKFYWKNKHQFINNQWVVIVEQKVLIKTFNKTEALNKVYKYSQEYLNNKIFITHVGNEQQMIEI